MSSNWSTASEQRATGWLNSIPGYSGYKDKERRRDADKQVRERVAAALSAQADRVDQIARALAQERQLSAIEPVDNLSKQLRSLVDRIAHATYGYGGIFSDRPIDEKALDQIRLFDESLFEGVDQLAPPITKLEQAAATKQDVAGSAAAVASVARQLGARLDLRGQIVETGQPAPEDQVNAALQVLKTPEEQKAESAPPAAYNLNQGDALSILGDNFIVDSRIEVDSADRTFRLFRVDTVPDRWLYVPNQPGGMLALLTATTDEFTEQPLTIGGKPYVADASGSGTSQISGAGGAAPAISVHYWLLKSAGSPNGRAVVLTWSGQRQVYVGNEVHPDDVEIFGPAKKP
jgi:hypothetical protein